jgi:uncharacterized protein (DUF433 family)
MSVAAEQTVSHIDATGARPVIAGTDIKVSQIASEYEHLGMSPDEIAEAHTHLGLSEVHAALAYYYDHRDVIHRDWADADTLIAKLQEKYPSRLGARAK